MSGHWSDMAARWRLVGPPLRPAASDLAAYARGVDEWLGGWRGDGPPAIGMLGVTPELHGFARARSPLLRAVDGCEAMIATVWPGRAEEVALGSWDALPLADASLDLLLCDGGLGTLPDTTTQAAVLGECARVLRPGGRLVVRLFAPPAVPADAVAVALAAGEVPSLDALKLMLWGALQHDGLARPAEVVAWIERQAGSWAALAEAQSWSAEHCASLELHRDSAARYQLIDADGLLALGAAAGLLPVTVTLPEHAQGAACPVVTLGKS